jgi:hypothetical protein
MQTRLLISASWHKLGKKICFVEDFILISFTYVKLGKCLSVNISTYPNGTSLAVRSALFL